MLELPRFKAAAVQAAPVFLDPAATAAKAASLIREAASNGAAIVAFPEVFIAGYPYWCVFRKFPDTDFGNSRTVVSVNTGQ